MSDKVLTSLRGMAWERAKGELRAALMTFYPEYDRQGNYIEGAFKELKDLTDKFIKDVEDNGLID